MTIRDIQDRIRAIEDDDCEGGHMKEDQLHRDVLRWIAENSSDENARLLAAEALKTESLDFERWYA